MSFRPFKMELLESTTNNSPSYLYLSYRLLLKEKQLYKGKFLVKNINRKIFNNSTFYSIKSTNKTMFASADFCQERNIS